MSKTFTIGERTVYAGRVGAHALTRGDEVVLDGELHRVQANPTHHPDSDKLTVLVDEHRAIQLFTVNEPVWRVYGSRAGAVGTR